MSELFSSPVVSVRCSDTKDNTLNMKWIWLLMLKFVCAVCPFTFLPDWSLTPESPLCDCRESWLNYLFNIFQLMVKRNVPYLSRLYTFCFFAKNVDLRINVTFSLEKKSVHQKVFLYFIWLLFSWQLKVLINNAFLVNRTQWTQTWRKIHWLLFNLSGTAKECFIAKASSCRVNTFCIFVFKRIRLLVHF